MGVSGTPCNVSFGNGVVRRRAFAAAAGLAALAIPIIGGCRGEPAEKRIDSEKRYEATRRLMGAAWTITAYAGSRERAEAAMAAAFDEVARLEQILSDYDPASELSQLSARSPVTAVVGNDLWHVLERAVWFRDASGGAFDPTVGPLTTLWRQARRSGRLPTPEKLTAARTAVGPATLQLGPGGRSVDLRKPGMRLDLGGIGMGYAVDAAMDVLERHGIHSAMIDASGDIAVSSPPPGKRGWRIAIDPLEGGMDDGEAVELVDAAVTTSGDAFQAVEIDGVRYSHIVDPRSGLGVAGPAAVTVIAADCTTADAAATAASVLGPEAGSRFIEGLPGAAARFQWIERGKRRVRSTSRWPAQPPRNTAVRDRGGRVPTGPTAPFPQVAAGSSAGWIAPSLTVGGPIPLPLSLRPGAPTAASVGGLDAGMGAMRSRPPGRGDGLRTLDTTTPHTAENLERAPPADPTILGRVDEPLARRGGLRPEAAVLFLRGR